jgi:hypothetical protein
MVAAHISLETYLKKKGPQVPIALTSTANEIG